VNLLYPLDEFYRPSGVPLPAVCQIVGEDVPEPYRRLLVHDSDMTPTLETHHGERVGLRVLAKRVEGTTLLRQVVLTRESDGVAVEFGAIAIHFNRFPPAAREEILACTRPLGTILWSYSVPHQSSPRAFIRITSDDVLAESLGLREPRSLYGRRNVIRDPAGNELADIVEILPP
jgi:chorismate-pyruvate lyase